jgi:gliding motility-associated-like protein
LNYNDLIFDQSDNGDDTDGNMSDDPTIIELESDYIPRLEVYELVTPNGDQKNDYLIIRGIEDYPDNKLKIYNRWGVLVFESNGYPGPGNSEIFTGYSNGRITINKNEKLPSGTYYYVLTFPSNNNPGKTEYMGYLYLQNNLQNE